MYIPIFNKSRSYSKVFPHLDIKYHMTCNILIPWRQLWYVLLLNFKSWSDVFHFFAYDAPPEGIAFFFAKWICLLNRLGDLDVKLVRPNTIIWLQLFNDTVAFFQHIQYSPCRFRVVCNTTLYRIFVHLYRIWVLHILGGHPCYAPTLKLEKYFNPLHCFSATVCSSTRRNKCFLFLQFNTVIPVVGNLLE